jgi:3D-(3,5/4)-trihydroxycyclohexane-1,2-dione acylhydrolase (decyclizing)
MIILILNNNGFASIGGLSESVGGKRFGTEYRFRDKDTQQLTGDQLPVYFAMNARSLGAHVIECTDIPSLKKALREAKKQKSTTVLTIETDLYENVEGYGWWDVAISEVSTEESVKKAYKEYIKGREKQRYYL